MYSHFIFFTNKASYYEKDTFYDLTLQSVSQFFNLKKTRIENSEKSMLGIESHRFQNKESKSDSIAKMWELDSPTQNHSDCPVKPTYITVSAF